MEHLPTQQDWRVDALITHLERDHGVTTAPVTLHVLVQRHELEHDLTDGQRHEVTR